MKSKDIIFALLKKELLDIFRDRKAVIMMLAVPFLLYPLIFIGVLSVMSSVQAKMGEKHYKAIIDAYDNGALEKKLREYMTDADKDTGIVDKVARADYPDPIKAIKDEIIDVYVTTEKTEDGRILYTVNYISSVTDSEFASRIIERAINDVKKDKTKKNLETIGYNADLMLNPIMSAMKDSATREQSTGRFLGMILPILFIISLLMGTVYPAIDVTAGEKERGTLETLLTLPVKNEQIIFSKFIAVATVGLISAGLNFFSIAGICIYVYRLTSKLDTNISLNVIDFIPAVLLSAVVVMVFSLFLSSVIMCVTSLTRSFKEANNFIAPLTVIIMLTGYIAFIPNIELTGRIALVPVANVILVIKNLFVFNYDANMFGLVIVSNLIYTIFALLLLGKIYSSENLLFDDGKSGIQIFERRSNIKKGGVPTSGDAWFILAVVVVHVLYVGSIAQLKYGKRGVLVVQAIILFVPIIFAIYTKRDLRKTFALRRTGLVSYLAGIMCMSGAILLGMILTQISSWLFPTEANQVTNALYSSLIGDNFWETLFLTAIIPCICEELMFRGFVFSGFLSSYKMRYAIILVAVSFGVYHMSIVRLATTIFLGAVLTLTVQYTKSIYPAMLMHFFNNALAAANMYHKEVLERIFPIAYGESSPVGVFAFILLGNLLFYSGIAILSKVNETNKREEKREKAR